MRPTFYIRIREETKKKEDIKNVAGPKKKVEFALTCMHLHICIVKVRVSQRHVATWRRVVVSRGVAWCRGVPHGVVAACGRVLWLPEVLMAPRRHDATPRRQGSTRHRATPRDTTPLPHPDDRVVLVVVDIVSFS